MEKSPVRIFVASDPRMGPAELALEQSVKENTTGPYEITWMRAGDPGWVGGPTSVLDKETGVRSWNIAREPCLPYPKGGWATDFTCFRWALPELCNFEGRAIYQDVDQIDVGDMRELFEMPMSRPVLCASGKNCVMLMDCAKFKKIKGWPSIDEMKQMGAKAMYNVRTVLDKQNLIQKSLPRFWNYPDRWSEEAKVIHFTNMHTQPWKPWPERFKYPEHRDQKAVKLFWGFHERATA